MQVTVLSITGVLRRIKIFSSPRNLVNQRKQLINITNMHRADYNDCRSAVGDPRLRVLGEFPQGRLRGHAFGPD